MLNGNDDLEALFEAEAAQYSGGAAVTAAPAVSIAAAPIAVGLAQQPDGGDDLARYYQAVSGLYLREPSLAGAVPAPSAASATATDNPMYERLGGIVRQLHDSLRELGYDKALTQASSQIEEASDRLAYIATLTEQSAVKVLNTLEAGMPAQDALIKQSKEMEARWALLFEGKIGIEEFKVLAADSRQFAATVAAEGEQEKARLLEIMMAQDFQDLTGQIIKKVVAVTKGIEQDLAQLLLENAPAAVKEKHFELMSGPSVPGAALDQGDVDDMLADLGF